MGGNDTDIFDLVDVNRKIRELDSATRVREYREKQKLEPQK